VINQTVKASCFQAMHTQNKPFLIPNPWDPGTARLLESLGFEALATTSLGVANMLGVKRATQQALLDNCRSICEATDLPVTIDLENGYADAPNEAAKMIRLACEYGAVGGSIEDWTGVNDPNKPAIYEFNLAVERIHAAAEMAKALPIPFVLTARAEDRLHGHFDLDETIKRLQAYEAVGADVLYMPGIYSLEEMHTVTTALKNPVNVVMGMGDPSITLDQLGNIGVQRVSIGGALSRLALNAFMTGAKQMRAGEFKFVSELISIDEIHSVFA